MYIHLLFPVPPHDRTASLFFVFAVSQSQQVVAQHSLGPSCHFPTATCPAPVPTCVVLGRAVQTSAKASMAFTLLHTQDIYMVRRAGPCMDLPVPGLPNSGRHDNFGACLVIAPSRGGAGTCVQTPACSSTARRWCTLCLFMCLSSTGTALMVYANLFPQAIYPCTTIWGDSTPISTCAVFQSCHVFA